jgi:hypothetical protein
MMIDLNMRREDIEGGGKDFPQPKIKGGGEKREK